MSESENSPSKPGLFARLKAGLARTATQLSQSLTGLFTKKKLDKETVQSLEEALIRADLGASLAHRLATEFAAGRYDKEISEHEVRALLAAAVSTVLKKSAKPFAVDSTKKP